MLCEIINNKLSLVLNRNVFRFSCAQLGAFKNNLTDEAGSSKMFEIFRRL